MLTDAQVVSLAYKLGESLRQSKLFLTSLDSALSTTEAVNIVIDPKVLPLLREAMLAMRDQAEKNHVPLELVVRYMEGGL